MAYEVVLLLARAGDDEGLTPAPDERALAEALTHSRDWPGAAAAVAKAKAALTLRDELPSPDRLGDLLAQAAAAMANRDVVAVWWKPAERLVAPATLQEAAVDDDPLRVALQVRLFHVETGRPGEHVVDTLGLEALGLPDVQCHFVDLPPDVAAAAVENAAHYLFDEGDVIGEGDTLGGPDGKEWTCRREESLLEPVRDVVDLEPPAPHGVRKS